MKALGITSTSLLLGLLFSLSLNASGEVPDVVGIWLFDDENDLGKDSSGNGQDGEIQAGAESVDGKFGKGVRFNGTNECIEVPDSDILDIDGDQVTITCWFWWEGSGDGWQTFVSKGPMSGTNENWAYFINSPSKHTHFAITPNGGRQTINSNMNAFEPKEWHFTAGTYDGKSVKIYMDGKLVTDQAMSGNTTPNDSSLRIGHREGSSHWWNGVLDEIAVFSRALSEDEINKIMNQGLADALLSVEPRDKLSTVWGHIKSGK
jgi:hypothetical protein